MNGPLVSICCLCYNHESYIRECLDGFLMQKTSFSFEVLIHDDASADRSVDIIREYEAKYPDIIKPIFQSENQFSKGVKPTLEFNLPRAKGKYVAMCEGDDYWTDPNKLQKQVDMLEANPRHSACVHRFQTLKGNTLRDSRLHAGNEITLDDLVWDVPFQTATLVFRKESLVIPEAYKHCLADTFIFMLLAEKGHILYIDNVMSIYRIHDGGSWTSLHEREKVLKREYYQNKRIEYFVTKGNIRIAKSLKYRLGYDFAVFTIHFLLTGNVRHSLLCLIDSFKYSKGRGQVKALKYKLMHMKINESFLFRAGNKK